MTLDASGSSRRVTPRSILLLTSRATSSLASCAAPCWLYGTGSKSSFFKKKKKKKKKKT